MTEPRHWTQEDATEMEKALLRAGREDGPRKGADARILAVLAAPPPAAVKPTTFTRWAKLAVAAAVVGGGAVGLRHLRQPPPAPGLAPVPPPVVAQATPAPAIAEPAPAVADEAAPPSPRERTPPPRRTPAPVRGASVQDHSLGEETKALDRARQALDDHQPDEVLRRLDDYRRRFPHGRLRPEATILRLAALVKAGRRPAAEALARQLLADPAYQPYVPRIQSLARELER